MSTAPVFRKSYLHSPAWSAACWIKGDGQCDGYVPEVSEATGAPEQYAGEPCGCPCHNGYGDFAADTVAAMEAAHRDYWHQEEHPTA